MKANNIKDKVSEKTAELADQAGEEMTKSGKEWLDYVRQHPLQSVLFGLVGYFALKGLVK